MRALVVGFILGAVFLSANASILDHIYNNTHLRGNMRVDTKDGIKLGYDGSLGFKNGFLNFEIANVGANFNVIARPGGKLGGNTTNGTVDYSGDIQISGGGGKKADVSVSGTAGLWAEYDKTSSDNGTSVGYNATLTNNNKWTASAGSKGAEGTSTSFLNVTGRNCYGKDEAFIGQKFRGYHAVNGNYTDGNESHTFQVTKYAGAGLKKKIYATQGTGPFPSIIYRGIAGFGKKVDMTWDNDTAQNFDKGGSKFEGMVWAEGSDNGDAWTHKIRHDSDADFAHKGKTILNGKVHARYGGVGTVYKIDTADVNVTKDYKNLSAGIFKAGNVHHIGIVFPGHKGDKEQLDKELKVLRRSQAFDFEGKDFEEFDHPDTKDEDHHHHHHHDHHDHHKGIKTYLHAEYLAGKGVSAHRNDDNTVDVDTRGGVVWDAVGADSKHRKPWKKHGGFGYNSSFEIDPNQKALRNVQLQLDKDPKMIEQMKQKFQGIEMIAHRW